MKKSNIRSGMVGVTKDGTVFTFLVMNKIVHRLWSQELLSFTIWDDNLKNTGGMGDSWDVDTMYENVYSYKQGNILWERGILPIYSLDDNENLVPWGEVDSYSHIITIDKNSIIKLYAKYKGKVYLIGGSDTMGCNINENFTTLLEYPPKDFYVSTFVSYNLKTALEKYVDLTKKS